MSITVVPEDGSGLTNANAFQATASITTLLAAHPFASAWAGKSSDEQDQLNVEATSVLSRLPWDGRATYLTQSLAFPRIGLSTRDGYPVLATIVPNFLKDAHARTALFLSQQTESPFGDTGLAPFTELVVGPIRLTPLSSAKLPADIRAIIAPYLVASGGVVRS